jgi:hypothetical protein
LQHQHTTTLSDKIHTYPFSCTRATSTVNSHPPRLLSRSSSLLQRTYLACSVMFILPGCFRYIATSVPSEKLNHQSTYHIYELLSLESIFTKVLD